MLFVLFLGLNVAKYTPSEKAVPVPNATESSIFNKISDVWFMTMLIATLMLPMKNFEWTVLVESVVTIATSYLTFMVIHVLIFSHGYTEEAQAEGVICAITAVISIGVFLGTLKMWQYPIVGLLFGICYAFVQWLTFTSGKIPGVIDPGAAITVHMFAAYWGVGVALVIHEKRILENEIKFSVHGIMFIYLSSILLWILWPSFVTIYYDKELSMRGMATCYMAGTGSIITAFITDLALEKKINSLVYAYALLGGDVAISSSLFFVGPWGGLLIGAIAGVASVCSFCFLHPWITKHLGYLDVMGVHNLHGICSWTSVICCFIGSYAVGEQGHWTLAAAVTCFVLALATGAICGLILKYTMCGKIPDDEIFNDHALFWFSEGEKEAVMEMRIEGLKDGNNDDDDEDSKLDDRPPDEV